MNRSILSLTAILALAPVHAGGEDGDTVDALARLCRAQLEQGDHVEAVATARRWLDLADAPAERAAAYHHLGLGLVEHGLDALYPHAEWTVGPRPLDSIRRHSDEARGTDFLEQAADAFRRAASERRSDPVLLALADALVRLEEYDEALEVLDDYTGGGGQPAPAKDLRCFAEFAVRKAEEKPGGGVQTGAAVKAPIKIHAPPPQYNDRAREARINGTIVVAALIDERGRVACARAATTLPKGLEEASVKAVRQWRFRPATLDGDPVATRYDLTINFTLQ